MGVTAPADAQPATGRRLWELLRAAGVLGLSSFGGPTAHIGYFHNAYVRRRRWLGEREFAELVGICQLLPGPASSQLGIAIGLTRGGLPGALVAWLAFTLPSAVLCTGLALLGEGGLGDDGWVSGLKLVAVAVVAHAVWTMGRTLLSGWRALALAVAATASVLAWDSPVEQLVVLALAGVLGWRFLPRAAEPPEGAGDLGVGVSRRTALLALALLAALLLALPAARAVTDSHTIAMTDSFYRTGALVFGGGHVVLPLLERQVVDSGWISEGDFLAGYGAAQAVPGPLFTFAAYLGAAQGPEPNGVAGAGLALVAIFLPGALLVIGVLPFWNAGRRRPGPLLALAGVNAAVVGILLAALYDPVFTSAVDSARELAIALAALVALAVARVPPLAVVAACALLGWLAL
jgi:chromate transporter